MGAELLAGQGVQTSRAGPEYKNVQRKADDIECCLETDDCPRFAILSSA